VQQRPVRRLRLPLDFVGVGVPLVAGAAFFVVGVRVDPLIVVADILYLTLYLAGYAMARMVALPRALIAAVAAIMMAAGGVLFFADRDAATLIYLAAPGCGLLVSSLAAAVSSKNAG